MQSDATVPTGPGWVKLSDKTYMNNLQPIKDRTLVFKGKQFLAGEWRPIAVKLITYDEKSQNEVQLHLKLENHPNIVRMYDAGVTKQPFPYIYIAMELCSQTLKDFIEERKDIPLDFQRYFDFAKQIVSAVAFIHKSNILHRDLKLENILVSPSKDYIRVADLGLSKQILEGHSIATASFRGIGSDGYRAPELLHEKPMASFRSDSFALGIILAMLFSNGRHPYGSDLARWRTNIADNIGKDLTHIVHFKEPYTHKRALFINLIEKCLEQDPKRRPTPNEMLQHGFFTGSSTDPPLLPTQGGHAYATVVENPSIPGENFDEKDPMEQFLAAKKAKMKKLENDLNRALRDGHTNPSRILEELQELSKADDLYVILQMAEYELAHKKDDACVERMCHLISDGGIRSAIDVRIKGFSLQNQGRYIQSMILYIVSHKLHKTEEKFAPDIEVKWIHDRVTDISSAIVPMLESGGTTSRNVARKFGVKYMLELIKELRAVDGATSSSKTLNEIGCLVNITSNINRTGEYEICIQYGEEGLSSMKQQFGDNAVYYKDYGSVLNNLGNAYGFIGQYSRAQELYSEAVMVKSHASGYKNEEDRQKDVAKSKHNLGSNCGKVLVNPHTGEP